VSDSAEEHIAATIAAVREGGRRWSALADDRLVAARAADRRACLLISLLCGVLLLCSVVACALALGPALRGTSVIVPIVVALFGLSGALPLYVVASAAARLPVAVAVARSGQALFLGAALGAVVAGLVVAFNGTPFAAVAGLVVGAAVVAPAVLGRRLVDLIQRVGGQAYVMGFDPAVR